MAYTSLEYMTRLYAVSGLGCDRVEDSKGDMKHWVGGNVGLMGNEIGLGTALISQLSWVTFPINIQIPSIEKVVPSLCGGERKSKLSETSS